MSKLLPSFFLEDSDRVTALICTITDDALHNLLDVLI